MWNTEPTQEESLLLRFAALLLLLGMLFLPVHVVISAPILPPLNAKPSGQQIAGKFTWFELASIDINKHKAFYADVFGWNFKTISKSDDQYTLIINNGDNIAGLFNVEPSGTTKLGGLWIGLMSVDDPEKLVSVVKKAGGKVHTPPTSLAQRGKYALFIDPEGALFGVLKSTSGDPVDSEIEIGEFFWMDLFAKDLDKSGKFYQQLAAYELHETEVTKDIKRLILKSANKPRAGIVPLPEGANRAGWLPYIKVDNIDWTLKKVTEAGGHVMVPPNMDLYDGNLAIFTDPLGGVMGIVKWIKPSTVKK